MNNHLAAVYVNIILIFHCNVGVKATSRLKVTCDPGWTASIFSGSCLKLSTDKRPWDSARKQCKVEGGDLVKIIDSNMNADIAYLLLRKRDLFYIGLKKDSGSETFKWLDELFQAYYLNFGDDGFHSTDQACVYINPGLVVSPKIWLRNIPCTQKNRYICEKGPELCPEEWVPSASSGTCIKVHHSGQVSWPDARSVCRAQRGDLVRIMDLGMHNFLEDQVRNVPDRPIEYWIGLQYRQDVHKYQWLDYKEDVKYTFWGHLIPHGNAIANCFFFSGDWESAPCKNPKKWICEKFSDCENEQYGMLCPIDCLSTNCGGSPLDCNRLNGNCLKGCKDGYIGNYCQGTCSNGTYGANCEELCSANCKGTNQTCDHVSGHCTSGCVLGYGGAKCDINIFTLLIVVAIAVPVLSVMILLGIYLRKRRFQQPLKPAVATKGVRFAEPSIQVLKRQNSSDQQTDISLGSSFVSSIASKSVVSSSDITSVDTSIDPESEGTVKGKLESIAEDRIQQ